MPWQSCCCEKQDWRGWDRDLRGWIIAICHNGICSWSWNLGLGSALMKPVGVKPYYSAVKCQKTSHVPQHHSLPGLPLKRSCTFILYSYLCCFMMCKCSTDVDFLCDTFWHNNNFYWSISNHFESQVFIKMLIAAWLIEEQVYFLAYNKGSQLIRLD